MTVRLASLGLFAALLAACATAPQPLQGDYAAITPLDATDHDSTGATVRWGGRIVQVEPGENQTCFEMLSTGLNGNGRPHWRTDNVGGRFIACRTGFYDPALFEKNREVTFTGRITGYDVRKVGGYDYRFPHVEADVVYLWPVRERVDVITRPAPWPWWGWW
ncbi:MAG TPA: Slp family lipoprotein [Xanthomonadaceae bacterium]|nr:Slp family lipoprotein [Xanthomonadaceae bacterium]